jgi:acetyl-CoA C-acetyltransferase
VIILTQRVAIVGMGHTRFGKSPSTSLGELAAEAGLAAINEAGLNPSEIEMLSVGVASGSMSGQLSPAASVADTLGLVGIPVYRSEAACASGSAALRTAYAHIASGLVDTALVVGAEVMTHVETDVATDYLAQMGDTTWEYVQGVTFPAYFALIASAHMKKYGTKQEDLARVAVKNHRYAVHNPVAQFHREVTVDEVMRSPVVAYPLKLLDCSPLSDGAAAVVLVSEDKARKLSDTPIWIRGMGMASTGNILSERKDPSTIPSIRLAARKAYAQSGVEPREIHFAEVHDCFTIAEIIAYEELGFAERGRGADLIREGQTELGGRIPVNMSGGLKAKGHPLGATGVSMAVEATKQLRGEAERGRAVKGAEVGLVQNMGLTGQYSFVTIYSR